METVSGDEISKLKEEAQTHRDLIRGFISTTSPQIDGFKNSHRKYYEYIFTACGVFAGLTQALLASNFKKIDSLATLGFIFFILAVIIALIGFRKGIIFGAKYTAGLKGIQKTLSGFSYLSTQFSSGEITVEEYKPKLDVFIKEYHDMRNNPDMKEADTYEDSLLKELCDDSFSNINLVTAAFCLGLIFVALAVVLPEFTCLK